MRAGRSRARHGVLMALAGTLVLLASQMAGAATVGPVTDPIGVIRVPKGAPIVIGGYWVLVRAGYRAGAG